MEYGIVKSCTHEKTDEGEDSFITVIRSSKPMKPNSRVFFANFDLDNAGAHTVLNDALKLTTTSDSYEFNNVQKNILHVISLWEDK